ncbi:MAG: O-antigen ligase family protein [Candidatus Sumerlaeaceae bacterium]
MLTGVGKPGVAPGFEALLRRLVLACVAAAVYMAALVYPWRLPDELFRQVERQPTNASFWAWLFHDQLRSQLMYTHSTLLYKEAVAQALLLTGLTAFFVMVMLRALRERKSAAGAQGTVGRLRRWMTDPAAWSMVLLLYLAVTLFGVRIGKWELLPGSPTFHYSMRTWFTFALGVFAVLAIPLLRVGRGWTVQFMAAVTGCGALVAFIALLQHVGLAGFFLPPFDDPRNRMSSLIGHNTGMSSWLMFPLSFALYFMLAGGRRRVRWTATVLVGLFLFVILAAQSRAIWVLGAAVTVVSVAVQFRLFHRRMRARNVLIGVAVVTALVSVQTVGRSWNPLARTPEPLFVRLKNNLLNLDQLRRETRLRTVVVSLKELVPKHPIEGTGFGTFQWVYPPAQGKYLLDNVDTRLGYTRKRTDLMHNDYVQHLVEAGIVGCVLLVIPVLLLLGAGVRALRRATIPHDRALLIALVLPVAGVSLHGLVDFPFHVMPTALLTGVSLGAFAAASRWTGTAGVSNGGPLMIHAGGEADRRIGVRWKAVAGLAAAGSALFWVPLAARNLIYREFASDIYMSDGQNWLQSFGKIPKDNLQLQLACLDRARLSFRNAIVTQVFNGAAYEGMAIMYSRRGATHFFRARAAERQGKAKEAESLFAAARGDFEAAITTVQNQMHSGELRYHHTYYLIGNSYRSLWRMKPDAADIRQMNYLKSARNAYEMAIETNVADVNSLLELSELLETMPQPDAAGAAKYRRLMFKVDAAFAQQMLLEAPITLAQQGDPASALERLEHLRRQLPDVPQIAAATALGYFYKAVWPPPQLDKEDTPVSATLAWRREALAPGEPLAKSIANERSPGEEADRLQMLYAMARGDYPQVGIYAERIKAYPHNFEAMAMRDLAAEMLHGNKVDSSTERPYYRAKNLYGITFGRDKRVAAMNLGALAFETKLTLAEATRLLTFYQNNGWADLTQRVLPEILKHYPNEPALVKYAGGGQATGAK